VLDPAVMPAVDAPDPGGIAYAELELLLAGLVNTPRCLGVELTVFDPDYDPDGQYAAELVELLVTGLAPVATTPPESASASGNRRAKVPLARSTFADFAPSPRRAPDETPSAPAEAKSEVTPPAPDPAPRATPEPVTVPTQPGPPDEPPAPKRQIDHGPGKLRRRPPS
jgi:arginase